MFFYGIFLQDFFIRTQISIFLVNVLKNLQILAFAELQIQLFCVEDMSPEPFELITAFESKVPFLRGHGLGVFSNICQILMKGPSSPYLMIILSLKKGHILNFDKILNTYGKLEIHLTINFHSSHG